MIELLNQYFKPAPRYTCYPTLGSWCQQLSLDDKVNQLKKTEQKQIDLYIHIPFCTEFCEFCACNVLISKQQDIEKAYLQQLVKEWDFISNSIPNLKLANLYLGGGTPNFISAEGIDYLLGHIYSNTKQTPQFLGICELDPRYIDKKFVNTLNKYSIHYYRMGVQDIDKNVLSKVNRNFSFEQLHEKIQIIREDDKSFLHLDLIYGLMGQTERSFSNSLIKILDLSPEAFSLFSLVTPPWLHKRQISLGHHHQPSQDDNNRIYWNAYQILNKNNYIELGMQHFFREDTPFVKLYRDGQIKKNIMSYVFEKSNAIIGLGASSISRINSMYFQNPPIYQQYMNMDFNKSSENFYRGHYQTDREQSFKVVIDQLMQNGQCDLAAYMEHLNQSSKDIILEKIKNFQQENIISLENTQIQVRPDATIFLKNIIQALDVVFI